MRPFVYNNKRNFSRNAESSGKEENSLSKLSFVVQKHKASRLHYDFRLELQGILKSWAIPKGPSLNPKDKRLAIMVEDHPHGYKDFEGVIPKGNYGAGTVEIWDEGFFSDIDNSEKEIAEQKIKAGLQTGNLKFVLYGKKLKGEFSLVKFQDRDNDWLLIKHNDKYAIKETITPARSALKKAADKLFDKAKTTRHKTKTKEITVKKRTKVITAKKKNQPVD